MAVRIIIPARYQSSRLPGKPLVDIAGQSMIQRAYTRACKANADTVIVATDDARIVDHVQSFGGTVCLTASQHRTGTERISEVIAQQGFGDQDIIVGLQCDEPLVPPANIDQLTQNLQRMPDVQMVTLAEPITTEADIVNPNVTKVIMDAAGFALYFSRASIPWNRDKQLVSGVHPYHRHIGLYVYRAGFLKQYISWEPPVIEQLEALEQLRVLYYGEKIHVDIAKEPQGPGIDSPADLDAIRKLLS